MDVDCPLYDSKFLTFHLDYPTHRRKTFTIPTTPFLSQVGLVEVPPYSQWVLPSYVNPYTFPSWFGRQNICRQGTLRLRKISTHVTHSRRDNPFVVHPNRKKGGYQSHCGYSPPPISTPESQVTKKLRKHPKY